AEGKSGGDRLGQANHVGLDPEMFECKELSGSSEAALDFVKDERCVMAIGGFAGRAKKLDGRRTYAALALDRFDHNGARFVGNSGVELLDVVAVHELNGAGQRVEILAVLRLAGERQRAQRAAMERTVEGNDLALGFAAAIVSRVTNQFQCAFNGFGAAVGEKCAPETGGPTKFFG